MTHATPLVRLSSPGDAIYGKLEYLHPSGSMKHRSIPVFLEQLLASGEVKRGQTIAIRSMGAAAVTAAWAGARIGCPVTAVVPPFATGEIVKQLEWLGATVHQIPPDEANVLMNELDAAPDIYVLHQATEARLIDHYRAVGEEIVKQLPDVTAITAGIGTGLSVTGIMRAVRAHRPQVQVFGVEPAEAPIAAGGQWTLHNVPGLAPPISQPLLDKDNLTGLLSEPSADAWHWAQRIARGDGYLIGPSAGITVAAAARLRNNGFAGPIVAICACSMTSYYSLFKP
ncbi:MAG: pyridoxal-phosphate dependent enzyme [Proteobacteria bacterium]|nr:pyridoxal-phosphate dependent enzyme [Pseudomonadota bacterium]